MLPSWENVVVSLRYNAVSASSLTINDYFMSGDSCGTTLLNSITSGNYRAVKGLQTCGDAWRSNPEASSFGLSGYTASTNRDLVFVGSSSLGVSGTITMRTGFNTFSSSTDI